ncbi:MAG: TOBE domain-containing protein, partial [Actinomycetota bacterium]
AGIKGRAARPRVLELMNHVGIRDPETRLGAYPHQLSGGQRQRVAMGRAIVREPQVFLMDEPLSNLDAKLRAQTRVELVELHRQLQTTIIYVTHDQVEAMTMADRIAILNEGRLQQVGEPQAVYERPANLFVARFIGSPPMNTLPGTARVDGGVVSIDTGVGSVTSDLGIDRIDAGAEVVAGIRPEHLAIADEGVRATVRAIEWLGHERHVYCDVDGTAAIVRDVEDGGGAASPGDEVTLGASPRDVHVFDAASTERID